MPYVKRNGRGVVIAVSLEAAPVFEEEVARGSAELGVFASGPVDSLDRTDQDFVRVLEVVVELLIDKGIILFTDLPQSAQDKIMRRQQLRSELGERLDLIGDD